MYLPCFAQLNVIFKISLAGASVCPTQELVFNVGDLENLLSEIHSSNSAEEVSMTLIEMASLTLRRELGFSSRPCC